MRTGFQSGLARSRPRIQHWAIASLMSLFAACAPSDHRPSSSDGEDGAAAAVEVISPFVDITEGSGIHFVHRTGASGRRYLPETMGSGCGFLDYDGDGDPDLYFANGTALPGDGGALTSGALYRNRGGGKFEDVTREAGVWDPIYGMGVATGDVDNDGDTDLFVSALGPDRLYINRGDGTFEEAAARAGVDDPGFGASAAFVDYDRDGDVDLYLVRYVEWSPATDLHCTLDGESKSYCTPELYRGSSDRLYRNRGDGTFEDVTQAAGVERPEGKSLGVAVLDANSDTWPDLVVANDTTPNYLFLNQGDGTFRGAGVESGMAYSESGASRGGMGIDAADYDLDGVPDILIGNFSKEMAALYRGTESGRYIDLAAPAGVGLPTLLTLAFASFIFDYDLDGVPDILMINGHIEPDIRRVQEIISYLQPPQLFRGSANGRFEEFAGEEGVFAGAYVGRGGAYADIDGDGDLDVAVTQNGMAAMLWRNEAGSRHSWIRVRPVGIRSNRSGLGATLRVYTPAGLRTSTVRSGSSYLSASEQIATVGLGDIQARAMHADLVWPDGTVQDLGNLPLNRMLTVVEGEPVLP